MVTKRRPRGLLGRKLRRDMAHSFMQFLAMLLLCMLGTWCFSGLDASWRMIDYSAESYLSEYALADFWVKGAGFTRSDLKRAAALPGVADAQARITIEMKAEDSLSPDGKEVLLAVHGTDGAPTINLPLLREGKAPDYADTRQCLLEEQFARAHGLQPGDTLTLRYGELTKKYTVCGLTMSPEYLITARTASPDPAHYGYALVTASSLAELPFTELLIRLEPGADAAAVEAALTELLPAALIVTQTTHNGTQTVRNYVVMFRNMSILFPVLAFAVAAMIVVATLTRMIENQRIQMGTLKALGFADGTIRRHYLCYALYPSVIGSLLGLFTGRMTLPYVIWNIIAVNTCFPWQKQAPISVLAWAMTGFGVLLALFICLRTYNKAARETTAGLLRPKPPKAGARLLLERIRPLWRRFSFNTKMIARNLLRNKGRTAVSLLGIVCCNMLIICTYCLSDSFVGTINRYYHSTMHYDLRAELDTSQAGTAASYAGRLDAEKVEGVMELGVTLTHGSAARAASLTVLPDDQTTYHLGPDYTYVALPKEGVLISRKLARLVNAAPGDTVGIRLSGDDETLALLLTGYAETNLGQGIFMSESAWDSLRKGSFAPTVLMITAPSAQCIRQLEAMDEVTDLKYPAEQETESLNILDSINVAFRIMTGLALGLAFIICYNMSLLNFTERTRDYATLKVLGYHQHEIRSLMLRESGVVALLGMLLGIAPGILLTGGILAGCETDVSVFTVIMKPVSVVIPCIITFLFAFLIELLLTRKVRGIDMVEALKSVE